MTVSQLYDEGLNRLKLNGITDSQFDCSCLFLKASGYNNTERIVYSENELPDSVTDGFLNLIDRRCSNEPLQYILGTWEFMGIEFEVGEGVLIPRPETELLVLEAEKLINNKKNCVVFDLCAGSGAIGLSLAKRNPDCKVFLFEKYKEAFYYLKRNLHNLNVKNAQTVEYDVFDGMVGDYPEPDLIVSNPPYIKSDEISFLQKEVLFEPVTALDGGKDGLDFYCCFCEKWASFVKKGGQLIFECADNQSDDIRKIFESVSTDITTVYDYGNIDRIVKINV